VEVCVSTILKAIQTSQVEVASGNRNQFT